MIKQFFENQDHFSFSFSINFLGKKESHTLIGMLCSFLLNIGCAAMFIIYILELFDHSKPNVNYSKIHKQKTTNMTLNTRDLLYTIGFRDKYYQILQDPTIASLHPIYERFFSYDNGSFIYDPIELDVVNCTEFLPLFIQLGLEVEYYTNGVMNYFCFNSSQLNEPVILGGKYGSEFYGNLKITAQKCIDSQENRDKGIICKEENIVNDAVQDAWIEITYASAFIDSDNYTHPIQYILDGYYTRLDSSVNKMLYTYFNLVNFYSENNIIFDYEKRYQAIKEDYETTDINIHNEDGSVFTVYICPSFTVENYKRTYTKIQEIVANVGGLYRCIFIVGYVLLSFYQSEYFNVKIMNYFIKTKVAIENPIKTDMSVEQLEETIKTKKKIKEIKLIDVMKSNICFCNSKYKQKKKELMYLMNKQKKFCDYAEVIKLLILLEKKNMINISNTIRKSEFNIDCSSKDILNLSDYKKRSTLNQINVVKKGNNNSFTKNVT